MRRIYHPYTKWECFFAGMFNPCPPEGMDAAQARCAYAEFLGDIPRFEAAMARVISEWPYSCEHFLTNESINRVAWLGQSAMCIETGVSSAFRSGFKQLTQEQQRAANASAAAVLTKWVDSHEKANRKIHQAMEAQGVFEWAA